jgi:hypothetical protein
VRKAKGQSATTPAKPAEKKEEPKPEVKTQLERSAGTARPE